MKLGPRPEGCGFEADIKGCVFQSGRQLSRGQPGGDVIGDAALSPLWVNRERIFPTRSNQAWRKYFK